MKWFIYDTHTEQFFLQINPETMKRRFIAFRTKESALAAIIKIGFPNLFPIGVTNGKKFAASLDSDKRVPFSTVSRADLNSVNP